MNRVTLTERRQEETPERVAWDVGRCGRLIVGGSVLMFTTLGLLHDPLWLAVTLGVAFNLVMTSLTDKCLLRDQLMRLGLKEREDLFRPGGTLRVSHRVPSSRRFSDHRETQNSDAHPHNYWKPHTVARTEYGQMRPVGRGQENPS